jgi:ubiquinone/menaquinone biosynthesis C-methylase UbiE
MGDEALIQRGYYRATASRYDAMHGGEGHEHAFPFAFMAASLDHLGIASVLDVGAGTGHMVLALKRTRPGLRVVGVEPSPELREQGYLKGLTPADLIDGDARALAFEDGAFDLVCEFGALHHMAHPDRAVAEMLRVARRAIFISDCNNFGQGSFLARTAKQALNAARLWKLANFVKTGGKGYAISEGDGLAYSYSVFNDYRQIRKSCARVHLLNTAGRGKNLYRSATHVALLGVK